MKGFKGEKKRDYFDKSQGLVSLPSDPLLGGIASDVFNKMNQMILSNPPRGLFFDNQWAKALWPKYSGNTGSPPQLNYCIQASCSTYGFLSAWVISVLDEIERNSINARFSISIHDLF